MAQCLKDWPAGWEDIDATGKRAFTLGCTNRWSEVRSSLEPRELDDALEQCDETLTAIDGMDADGSTCDTLRALYIFQ